MIDETFTKEEIKNWMRTFLTPSLCGDAFAQNPWGEECNRRLFVAAFAINDSLRGIKKRKETPVKVVQLKMYDGCGVICNYAASMHATAEGLVRLEFTTDKPDLRIHIDGFASISDNSINWPLKCIGLRIDYVTDSCVLYKLDLVKVNASGDLPMALVDACSDYFKTETKA